MILESQPICVNEGQPRNPSLPIKIAFGSSSFFAFFDQSASQIIAVLARPSVKVFPVQALGNSIIIFNFS
jgi:hypothetical protein